MGLKYLKNQFSQPDLRHGSVVIVKTRSGIKPQNKNLISRFGGCLQNPKGV